MARGRKWDNARGRCQSDGQGDQVNPSRCVVRAGALEIAIVAIAIALGIAGAGVAQPSSPSPCAQIDDGQMVRVAYAGATPFEASFSGCRGDTLLLLATDGLRAIPLAAATGLWVRERGTKSGFKTGRIIGAVAGGLFGTLLAMMVEGEDADIGAGQETVIVGLSVLAGYLTVGGAGAILGTAFEDWREVPLGGNPSSPADAVVDAERTRTANSTFVVVPVMPDSGQELGRIGSIEITTGGAWVAGRSLDTAGVELGAALTGDYPSGFGFGGEISWQRPGDQPRSYPYSDGYRTQDSAWHLGLIARYERRRGPVRPFVTAGIGFYDWDDGFLGGSLGAGVAIPLHVPHSVIRVEYRRHDNLQNLVDSDPGFHAVTLGLARSW